MPKEKNETLRVTLKNGEIYDVVDVTGLDEGKSTPVTFEPRPEPIAIQDLALELAKDFASQTGGEKEEVTLEKLGDSYQLPMSNWFESQGFITFGYHLETTNPFATDVRLQLTAKKYVEAPETPEVKEKIVEKVVEKVVEVPVDKVEAPAVHGLLTDEQAKTLKGKALPPFLNGTKVINDLAFTDTFVAPVKKIEFIIITDDDMELKVAEKTLIGTNTHNPEFLDTIRDAFAEIAGKYAKLLPKYDYTDLIVITGFNAVTGVYTIRVSKAL